MPLPREYDCTFRMTLGKSIRQPLFTPYRRIGRSDVSDRPDVFLVLADGTNLEEVMADVRDGLERRGLPALELFRDPSHAYRSTSTLCGEEPVPSRFDHAAVLRDGKKDRRARRHTHHPAKVGA
jgi:hypothetical protein